MYEREEKKEKEKAIREYNWRRSNKVLQVGVSSPEDCVISEPFGKLRCWATALFCSIISLASLQLTVELRGGCPACRAPRSWDFVCGWWSLYFSGWLASFLGDLLEKRKFRGSGFGESVPSSVNPADSS